MIKIKLWYFYFFSITILSSCGGNSSNNMSRNESDSQKAEWKTGVALYSFNRFSFVDALAKADSAGAKYVEGFSFHKLGKEFNDSSMAAISDAEIDRMKQMLEKKSIEMQSMYVGGAKDAEGWKYYFEMAKKLGMHYLVCEPEKEQWDMLDSLAGLYQIKIAIHEHAKGKSIYWHPDSVLAAIKGLSNFGACADLGHWVRSGLNPVDCLKKLEGHVIGVHIKDLDESNNINANDVTVGKGVIDFPAIITELKRQQFKGNAYVECEHDWENNLPDVTEAMKYFDSLSKQ
jgi:sugar phosphate isomerase/epimerase